MNAKAVWSALPLLIIALAAGVLWRGGGEAPVAGPTLVCADLVAGCASRLHGREVQVGVDVPVKPLQPFQLRVRAPAARQVRASFTMEGMDMGFNLYTLRAEADGVFQARVTLPVCVTGRRDWIMALEIDGETLRVPFSSEP